MPGGYINGWSKLERMDDRPEYVKDPQLTALQQQAGIIPEDEVWLSDRYQVVVRYAVVDGQKRGRDELLHLSIHSHDRGPMRNWRHLQQIKNEVAGETRIAVEVFPGEDMLVDTSNEYHLWVMPTGFALPFGFDQGIVVADNDDVEAFNAAPHKGRQEPWEPGLTTGRNEHNKDVRDVLEQQGLPTDGGLGLNDPDPPLPQSKRKRRAMR